MSFVSTRLHDLKPSQTLAITAEAKKLIQQGEDVCSFGAGEPDMDTPDFIKEAAIEALHRGETKYTAVSGIMELREAIATKLVAENGIPSAPELVTVSCGAKHALFNAIYALCEDDDEVIIPAPYWTSYPDMVKMTGADPVIVETKAENGWKMTPEEFEEAMSPRTKLLILNSPSNPTGAVYTKEELEKIAEIAIGEDVLVISDEIYEKLVYGEAEHVSLASLGEEIAKLTLTVNGFSKAYSMTGWRLGYTSAPEEYAKVINSIQSQTTSNPTSFAQYGGLAALTHPSAAQVISDMRDEFDVRRQYMLNRLASIENVSTVEPEGAFYFLVDTSKIGINSLNLAERLLSRDKVAVIPGAAFGHDQSVRFSYACGLDIIKNGMDRFEDFCRSF
ncbi:MAG: pyridoxal phosphate-dependent aminotransferase [Verrucomicrobiota bacterium]